MGNFPLRAPPLLPFFNQCGLTQLTFAMSVMVLALSISFRWSIFTFRSLGKKFRLFSGGGSYDAKIAFQETGNRESLLPLFIDLIFFNSEKITCFHKTSAPARPV